MAYIFFLYRVGISIIVDIYGESLHPQVMSKSWSEVKEQRVSVFYNPLFIACVHLHKVLIWRKNGANNKRVGATLRHHLLWFLSWYRKGAGRFLVVTKKTGIQTVQAAAVFNIAKSSRNQIRTLLQRFPVTTKERQELQPRTERGQYTNGINRFNS